MVATGGCGRSVDQHGDVLDVLVQSRRNRQAAEQPSRELASTHKSSREGHASIQISLPSAALCIGTRSGGQYRC